MKKLPNLKQLHYLSALFKHQHFGRAAESCCITQSTLSASITELESFLGVSLLEREHKSFVFTPMGEALVQRSRALLEDSLELIEYIKNQGSNLLKTLRIGCIPTIAPFLMSPLLSACKENFPALKLFIREDTTENALNLLNERQLDLVILALPYTAKNFYTKSLCKDPFQLVLSKNWAAQIEGRELHCWPDESLFLLDKEHCLTEQTLSACQIENNKKINPFYATSLHTLTQMVNVDLGVTFLPDLAIKSGILKNTQLMTVPMNKEAYREIGVAFRQSSPKIESCSEIVDLIKKLLLEIQKQQLGVSE
jgi:LysR family hydrogen peroxide-inducible transcriptional activator